MEVIIKGEVKEIAALLLEIEGRRKDELDVDKIFQSLSYEMSKGGKLWSGMRLQKVPMLCAICP